MDDAHALPQSFGLSILGVPGVEGGAASLVPIQRYEELRDFRLLLDKEALFRLRMKSRRCYPNIMMY